MNKKLIIAALFAIVATAAGLRHPGSTNTHSPGNEIIAQTQQQHVADYLHQYQRLPSLYYRHVEQVY